MIEWNVIIVRLALATLLGGLVGFERERKDWAVGIRTHMMAAMGSALVMIVSAFGFSDILDTPHVNLDPSRIASSVIIGIGYLGAGIILVLKKGNIKGLTTASGLLTTAGIGLAVGGGLYVAALGATIMALIILYGVQLLEKKMKLTSVERTLIVAVKNESSRAQILEKLTDKEINFSSFDVTKKRRGHIVQISLTASERSLSELVGELEQLPVISSVKVK